MSKRIIAGAGVVAGLAVALAPVATFATDFLYPNKHQDRLSVTIEKVCSFGYDYTDGDDVTTGLHTDGDGTNTDKGTGTVHGTAADADKTAGKNYGKWDVTEGAVSAYDEVLGDEDGTEGEQALYSAYNGAYGSGTSGAKSTTVVTDTAYGIMENNTANATFAKTKLNIVCNNAKGYTLTAISTDLTSSGLNPIAQTNSAPTAGTSNWTFKVSPVANGATTPETPATTDDRTITVTGETSSYSAPWQNAKSGITIVSAAPASAGKTAASFRDGDAYEITYGVGLSTNQEAGTYEGTITYTLAQTL